MTFYLSAYRSQPAAVYLLARVRLARKEIERDLQIGLNVAYVEQESQTVTLYPFEKRYSISDAEWLRWKELQDADAISFENTGICYRFYQADAGDAAIVTGLACNTNCVMCPVSESSRRHAQLTPVDELKMQLRYFGTDIPHITITGGEPTLLKQGLLEVVQYAKEQCPSAEILILTNGRTFSVAPYAQAFNRILIAQDQIAIPIHGSNAERHDAITQAQGSFAQTIQGLRTLAQGTMRIEIRIVVSKLNYRDISNIVDLLLTLPRITVVNFIALEMCGNAIKNRAQVWIDYLQAAAACEDGIEKLVSAGIDIGLYNFPLCAVKHKYWTLCRDSISDYKIRYTPVCESCKVKSICYGVFNSTISTGCLVARPIAE